MSMFIITSGKKDSFISRLYRAKVTEIFYLFDKYLCGFLLRMFCYMMKSERFFE